MSGASRTREFFENGTSGQFDWVLNLYDEALKLKAENKSSKPENVIKLDKWYQTELPKKIKARGKEAHLIHDELVQTIKWKLGRGKFQANMVNLIQMNTPRVVMQETKKAFRNIFKRGNLESAAQALCNLKGVGPTMASAVLAAGAPHLAPFMADECLLAMPDGESLDYTMKEYMRFVEYTQSCVDRLKSQGGDWTPHKVELAVWTHSILNDLKPELLSDLPARNAPPAQSTASATIKPVTSSAASISSNGGTDQENGASTSDEECGSKAAVSSVSNGEDSVSSPPPAGFSTPSPSQNTGENGNGNHGDYDDDSNAAKNGDDFSFPATSEQDDNSVSCDGAALSNDVTSGSVVTNDDDNAMPVPEVAPVATVVDDAPVNGGASDDRILTHIEEPAAEAAALPEIIIPATNGNGASVQENGATEIASEKVSETSYSSSSPPPSIQADDVVTSPKQLVAAAAVKRAATPEANEEEAVEAEPATKKFKPEESEHQPEAAAAVVVATAVV